MDSKSDKQFSEAEARKRFEAALRGARVVGHKPQSDMKLGKPSKHSSQRAQSPKRKKAVEKRR